MMTFTRWERRFMRPTIEDFTKPMLLDALRRVQHFLPPRASQQPKIELVRAVYAALNSERYREQMQAVLREVRRQS